MSDKHKWTRQVYDVPRGGTLVVCTCGCGVDFAEQLWEVHNLAEVCCYPEGCECIQYWTCSHVQEEVAKEWVQTHGHFILCWNGETHFDAGVGLTTSVVLCSLHQQGPTSSPTRSSEDRPVPYWSDQPPTCTLCREVAAD